MVKNLPANAGNIRDVGSTDCVGKIPWGRKQQATPVFLPGKFHGQRSLAGYSPRGCEEAEMTEHILTPPLCNTALVSGVPRRGSVIHTTILIHF